ncbi:MAG: class I SAM-dependent methyltransferase [Chloroflexota bacterium]
MLNPPSGGRQSTAGDTTITIENISQLWSCTMQAHIGRWTISIEREPFTTDTLTDKYDALSLVWDATLSRLGFDRAYANLFSGLQKRGILDTLPDDATIFDAGIGTGALCYALATQHAGSLDIHGLDISREMLNQAEENLAQLGHEATLRTGDANNLPYQPEQFDWVMTAHMLEHLDDPYRGLCELARVTKRGGIVMVITTRTSLIGNYIDWQWRLNRIEENTLVRWMANVGLTGIQPVRFSNPMWSNWMSMIYIGTKR